MFDDETELLRASVSCLECGLDDLPEYMRLESMPWGGEAFFCSDECRSRYVGDWARAFGQGVDPSHG